VIFDMVGNVDEWVDDETGRFAGGFYARATNSGCESQVASHSPLYYDYSIGVRCCKTP
jgi:formylglycine-generating enzyme required for sulfatase activity